MVRWWAAFFVCGMISPPKSFDVWFVLATAGAAGLFVAGFVPEWWRGDVIYPAGSVKPNSPAGYITSPFNGVWAVAARARAYCLVAAAGGIILWQAAGLGRDFHEAYARAPSATVSSRGSGRTDAPQMIPSPPRVLHRVSLPRVKEYLARSLDDGRLPGRARALVAALVLDERTGLRASLREAYAYLGITHFLALSGLHLGVIACALERLLAPIARGARRREAILLVLLAGYCSVVCFPPSLVRSYALIAAVTAYRAAGLSSDLFGALAAGSLVVAAIDPAVPFDAGFQLSFAAVCGIAFVGLPLIRRADERLPAGIAGRAARAIAYPAIITCAVQFFTLPLTVSLFDRSSLLAPLANIVVSLPFTALLYGGIVYVFVPLAAVRDVLATPIALVCRFLDAAPSWLARGPHPAILGGEGNWAIYGCGVIAVAHALGPACRRRAAFAVCGALLAAGSFAGAIVIEGRADSPVSGGRGGMAAGEIAGKGYRYLPGGGGVLFIGSSFGEREARALVRALWRRGAHAIDCCVIVPSRLRRGHGWSYLARRVTVRRCLASPYLAPGGGSFRASCRRAGIECVVVSSGARPVAGPVVLEVIGPSYPPSPGEMISSLSARLLCRVAGGTEAGADETGGIDPDGPAAGVRERRR